MEKLLTLYEGMAIYKVHLDELRERDINARVMDKKVFDRLSANVKKDARLESLPLCCLTRKEGREEMAIISGHHRTRAARAANLTEVYVMAFEDGLTEDEIKSKQLAHNAINGHDDVSVLKAIYESIEDLNEKLASGVMTFENEKLHAVTLQEVDLDFGFEIITIFFLSTQLRNFDKALSIIQKSEQIMVADYEQFEKFKEAVKKVSLSDNIRNISAIMNKMSEIVIEHYNNVQPDEENIKQNGKSKRSAD